MAEFSYLYREFVMRTLRLVRQAYVRLTGRAFHCSALSGGGVLGCYVNSDMTVSCNCQDVDGTGQLGDLRQQTFEQVFAGEKANHLRRALARRRLPLSRCSICPSLSIERAPPADHDPLAFQLPRGLCIENTSFCNLRCLSCCREQVQSIRGRGCRLTRDDVNVLGRTLQRLGATVCGFYNLGEPFSSPSVREEMETIRKYNPDMRIFISTNGVLIDNESKRAAALLADHIVFSIDGISTEMVQRYQRGGDFDRAYRNMKAVVELRNTLGREKPLLVWKYVVFRWNDHPATIRELLALAEAAGVDYVQLTFARTPWYGVSWRFFGSPFFRSLAKLEQGRFRNIWFSKTAEQSEYRVRDAA